MDRHEAMAGKRENKENRQINNIQSMAGIWWVEVDACYLLFTHHATFEKNKVLHFVNCVISTSMK